MILLFRCEACQPDIMGEADGICISKPLFPNSTFLIFCVLSDSFISLHLRSQQVIQQIIFGRTGQFLKEAGTLGRKVRTYVRSELIIR